MLWCENNEKDSKVTFGAIAARLIRPTPVRAQRVCHLNISHYEFYCTEAAPYKYLGYNYVHL